MVIHYVLFKVNLTKLYAQLCENHAFSPPWVFIWLYSLFLKCCSSHSHLINSYCPFQFCQTPHCPQEVFSVWAPVPARLYQAPSPSTPMKPVIAAPELFTLHHSSSVCHCLPNYTLAFVKPHALDRSCISSPQDSTRYTEVLNKYLLSKWKRHDWLFA